MEQPSTVLKPLETGFTADPVEFIWSAYPPIVLCSIRRAAGAVELVWSHLKRSLKNRLFTSLEALQAAVLEEVDYLQADRKRIRCFFDKKEVAFFTD